MRFERGEDGGGVGGGGGGGGSAHVGQEPAYIYLQTQRSFSRPFIGSLTASLDVCELYNNSKTTFSNSFPPLTNSVK